MRHNAFTTRYNGRTRVIHTQVGICEPVTQEEAKTREVKLKQYLAIWDTGATHSAITKKVADELGLKPTGVAEVRHADGKSPTNTYLVNISLPNKVMVGQVRVTEVKLIADDNTDDNTQPQVLIGMDIIGMGDFAITHPGGKTTVSFLIPSSQEIDFIPEADRNNVRDEGGNRHQRRALLKQLKKQQQ